MKAVPFYEKLAKFEVFEKVAKQTGNRKNIILFFPNNKVIYS